MMENILDISLCVIQSRLYNNNIIRVEIKNERKKIVVYAMMGDGQ